jgi:uncharacterized iron-regulated protein
MTQKHEIMQRSIYIAFVSILLTGFSTTLSAQKPAYTLFNAKGKETRYEKMVNDCKRADVILFGELHNNPIAHWLQLELTKELHADERVKLVLGAEMFEADGQLIMDEYFSGMITEKKFEEEMRLWNNYKTDYKPLVEFAKESGLRFIATNIPRRYANTVFNLGLDTLNSLTDIAKTFMMPLPVLYDTTLASYTALVKSGPMGGHGNPNLRDAQAVKDATMAFFILKNHRRGETFLHFNGAYHSDNYEGIGHFLKVINPDLRIVTISTVSQEEVTNLEESNLGKADYIIAVPESMTKTY